MINSEHLNYKQKKRMYIFGTGSMMQDVINQYNLSVFEIVGYLDNDASKWGDTLQGLSIISPKELAVRDDYDYILICSSYYEDIMLQLKDSLNIEASKILLPNELRHKTVDKDNPIIIDKAIECIVKSCSKTVLDVGLILMKYGKKTADSKCTVLTEKLCLDGYCDSKNILPIYESMYGQIIHEAQDVENCYDVMMIEAENYQEYTELIERVDRITKRVLIIQSIYGEVQGEQLCAVVKSKYASGAEEKLIKDSVYMYRLITDMGGE